MLRFDYEGQDGFKRDVFKILDESSLMLCVTLPPLVKRLIDGPLEDKPHALTNIRVEIARHHPYLVGHFAFVRDLFDYALIAYIVYLSL